MAMFIDGQAASMAMCIDGQAASMAVRASEMQVTFLIGIVLCPVSPRV